MLPRVNIVRTDTVDYMLFSTADAISQRIYSTGTWAPPILTISELFLQDLPAPLVLDVGANLGGYALPLAKSLASRGGMVYAYEPQRIVYYQLCGNAVLNRLDNLYAFNYAIGATDGSIDVSEVDFDLSKNIGGFSLDADAQARPGHVVISGAAAQTVPLFRLDSLQLPAKPVLIKVDVEGMELRVMRGAVQLLESSNFPPLLLEAWTQDWFQEQRKELLEFLHYLGYSWFALKDEIFAQHPNHPRALNFTVDAVGTINISRVR